jgi:urease accessory protein UreH
MEGFNYVACLALFAEGFEPWPDVAVAMKEKLAGMHQIVGGVSLLSSGGCVVRFLANSAADLTGANAQLWAAARELVLDLPPFDLRKY